MSSAATPTLPRPSVFLSYASEDRTAARALRDALAATGLEVWYDENELGGGDAWDQKIRRQIRDCDYFMPMISAATEKRKEGYFRREWRLASERTLDMADDVMFLLPVVIDGTSESGARVPDKFMTVQWLRLPGGLATPALEALCRRLLAGEHTAPPRPAFAPKPAPGGHLPPTLPPAMSTPPPVTTPPPLGSSAPSDDAQHQGPPPMPPFPHAGEKGNGSHGLKYLAEVFWWVLTAALLLFRRSPKWLRIVFSVWFVFFLFSLQCSRNNSTPSTPTRAAKKKDATPQDAKDAIAEATEKAKTDPNFKAEDLSKLGEELARRFTTGIEAAKAKSGKVVTVIPFALGFTDPATTAFANDLFSSVYGRLMTAQPSGTGMNPEKPAAWTDASLVAYGKKVRAAYILAACPVEGSPTVLSLRLVHTDDGVVAWTANYPADPASLNDVSAKVSDAVLAALPKK